MSDRKELAHFLYGRGFWYAHPLDEIKGLTDEQLFWTPEPNGLCALWQVGHIAHRERLHIGRFLQGLPVDGLIPPEFEVFGHEWCSVEKVREAIPSVQSVLDWVRDVRAKSHEYIASVDEEDLQKAPPTSADGLSAAHWLFITVAHGALHIGRIQLLRALIEGTPERAC
jgi:hypothetical protein